MELLRLLNGELVRRHFDSQFDMECDVLCVGAGSAGIYAADAAARNGAKTILLENDVTVGGMHILGNVRGCYYGFHGGSFEEDSPKEDKVFHFKVDKKQVLQLRRLEKAGVRLLCGCTPTGLLVEDDRVVGVLAFDGEEEKAIRAKVTVDATSDGFLLRILPVEKFYGRPLDGKMAPYSVIGTIWDGEKYRMVNRDAGYIDPYDSRDFSRKALLAHAQGGDLLEKGRFLNLATHTGVREGLRFAGEEVLSYKDALSGKQPRRVLFWAYSDLDLHGHLRALDEDLFQVWWVLCNMATVALRIPVPMGAVIPKGWKGIATAGRCLSADSYIQAGVRMNRDCFRMGQCVGTAAALAVDGDLLASDYEEYLRRVADCFAGDGDKVMGYDSPHRDVPYRPVEADWRKNLPLVNTDVPGPLLWSAFRCEDKEALAQTLLEMLEGADTLCRYNIALALGVMGDKRALPILREMVANRDCFYFKDCRRSNQFRSVMAVNLLGRLGEEADIPALWEIVFGEKEFDRALYHTLPPHRLYYGGKDRNFLYFDMFTHAAAALVKLHRRLGLPTNALHREFARLLEEGDVVRRIAPNCRPEQTPVEETLSFLEKMVKTT